MGIDIYAHWCGQTATEEDAQVTGFGIAHGHVGYLREAYHGEPYATRVLVPEALRVARTRQLVIYGRGANAPETRTIEKSFGDFVTLCERKEQETGVPCRIVASY
jgi:hypothetical protein